MENEELALKILEKYVLSRQLTAAETADAYFAILSKVKGSSDFQQPEQSSSMDLPGIPMDLPGIPSETTPQSEVPPESFSIFEQPSEQEQQSVPESVGFFDLALNTPTLCKTDMANEPAQEKKSDPEEKDMLDEENYYE
jgi:hypothetical protein